jgi:glycosyltransferase involved in cell wall biosynthesis
VLLAVHITSNDKSVAYAETSRMVTVAFVVGGAHDSPMGYRARAMATRLSDRFSIPIAYRSRSRVFSILSVFTFLVRVRPDLIYLFDISYMGVLGATFYKLVFRSCLIIETGDAIVELVRSTGSRGKVGLGLTQLLENIAFGIADRIVVRGTFHKEYLSQHGVEADVIQDGVDTDRFTPEDASELRTRLGLDGVMTVGLIGSSVWSEKLQMCYGWDLVETLRLLKDRPVKGIMIGSGSGISHLKALSRQYETEDKIVFLDHVPYEVLPHYLNLIDICLSTQTNNLVGKVRTTGKLPLYLATGRYILASDVGEATIVLGREMRVDYVGDKDREYPQKLKRRIEAILEHPELLELSANNVALAKKYFDYAVLAERMKEVIEKTIRIRQTKTMNNENRLAQKAK